MAIGGDRNTSFFNKVTKIRQASKALSTLRDGDNILSTQEEIAQHVLAYFTDLYVSPNDACPNHLIQLVIPSLVSNEDNTMLTKHPTIEEIKNVVFDMNGEGVPGPDGFGDVFSRGISKLASEGRLTPIAGPSSLKIPTHVLYADDILIFCKGLKSNLLSLNSLIHDYAQASTKCKFYTCSGAVRRISTMSATLGFNVDNLPFNYLGVHLFKGEPRRLHLQPITDKIIVKLATWKGLSLSIMGRVELVKLVIHSMLAYSFHIYDWPSNLIKELDMCPTKVGELGLRSIKHMNQAALLKLSWEMNSSEHEWALFCRQRFGRETSYDNWLGSALVDLFNIPLSLHSSLVAKVVDFVIHTSWTIPRVIAEAYPNVVEDIVELNISSAYEKLIWQGTTNGTLTLKAAFNCLNAGFC
ncbi:hypothetical protein Lal_00032945 [Lupinus albus]|nr:hypothetical protein Lal_00032945 [Lupinus albus]